MRVETPLRQSSCALCEGFVEGGQGGCGTQSSGPVMGGQEGTQQAGGSQVLLVVPLPFTAEINGF